ncbi:MAG TPA: hypothetical protein VFU81_05035 [Thermomicrobiales bacterium]|nr:hypothetical protein [Thermomicrobiales bacterium]
MSAIETLSGLGFSIDDERYRANGVSSHRRTAHGIDQEHAPEALSLISSVERKATEQRRRQEMPRQFERSSHVVWQRTRIDLIRRKRVIASNPVILRVREHMDDAQTFGDVLACGRSEKRIEGRDAAIEFRPHRRIVPIAKTLDAIAASAIPLTAEEFAMALGGGEEPIIGLRWIAQRFGENQAVASREPQHLLLEDRIRRRSLTARSDELGQRRAVQRRRLFPGSFHLGGDTNRDALNSTRLPELCCRHGRRLSGLLETRIDCTLFWRTAVEIAEPERCEAPGRSPLAGRPTSITKRRES